MRAGHFPNITHAQALVGRATGRFERAMAARGARVEWKTFNAGPSAIEALFAGEFGLSLRGVAREGRERAAADYLRMVHLSAFRHSYIHELSGGMKQRVALAMDPRMLLMDEPFAALDAQTRDILHDELQEIWARTGKTIFFVTHNVLEAATLADRIVTFTRRPGRISEVITVGLPHPRQIDDPEVVALAASIRRGLRKEIAEAILEDRRDA